MNSTIKTQWTKALKSGKYQQGRGRLRSCDKKEYCVQGVLADLHYQATGREWPDNALAFLSDDVRAWAGLTDATSSFHLQKCMSGNDNGETFEELADYIDSYL